MVKVIQAKDSIKFYVRNEKPLRAEIEFKNLGDTKMVFFIAPRVEEIEFRFLFFKLFLDYVYYLYISRGCFLNESE